MAEEDKEATAISAVVNALAGLDEKASQRVLEYALKRFAPSGAVPAAIMARPSSTSPAVAVIETPFEGARQVDIKELKDEKQPANGIQMAVLVAYYLKDVAPAGERKDSISNADVEKYFNQARFPLPAGKKGVTDTLNNARRAGYLETAGTNQFKLNSVGYNLAAYNLPLEAGKAKSLKSASTRKKKAKKKSR